MTYISEKGFNYCINLKSIRMYTLADFFTWKIQKETDTCGKKRKEIMFLPEKIKEISGISFELDLSEIRSNPEFKNEQRCRILELVKKMSKIKFSGRYDVRVMYYDRDANPYSKYESFEIEKEPLFTFVNNKIDFNISLLGRLFCYNVTTGNLSTYTDEFFKLSKKAQLFVRKFDLFDRREREVTKFENLMLKQWGIEYSNIDNTRYMYKSVLNELKNVGYIYDWKLEKEKYTKIKFSIKKKPLLQISRSSFSSI